MISVAGMCDCIFFFKKKEKVIGEVELLRRQTRHKENEVKEIQGPSSERKTGVASVGSSLLFVVDEHCKLCAEGRFGYADGKIAGVLRRDQSTSPSVTQSACMTVFFGKYYGFKGAKIWQHFFSRKLITFYSTSSSSDA